jgi:hypothetical protein
VYIVIKLSVKSDDIFEVDANIFIVLSILVLSVLLLNELVVNVELIVKKFVDIDVELYKLDVLKKTTFILLPLNVVALRVLISLFLEINVLVVSVELMVKKFIDIDDIFNVDAFNSNTPILLAIIVLVLSVLTLVVSEFSVLTIRVELTVR